MRSRVLYTPPVKPWELGAPKTASLTRKGGRRLRWNQWLGLSRNKVAVRERAAGSPPLKELFQSLTCKNLLNNILSTSVSNNWWRTCSVYDRYSVDSKRTEKMVQEYNVNLSIQVIQIVKHKQTLTRGLKSSLFFCIKFSGTIEIVSEFCYNEYDI